MRDPVEIAAGGSASVMTVVLQVMQTLYHSLTATASVGEEGAIQLRYLIDAAQQSMDTLADFIQVFTPACLFRILHDSFVIVFAGAQHRKPSSNPRSWPGQAHSRLDCRVCIVEPRDCSSNRTTPAHAGLLARQFVLSTDGCEHQLCNALGKQRKLAAL